MKDCLPHRKPIKCMKSYFENKSRGNRVYALGFNHLHFQGRSGVTESVFQTNPLTFHPVMGEPCILFHLFTSYPTVDL